MNQSREGIADCPHCAHWNIAEEEKNVFLKKKKTQAAPQKNSKPWKKKWKQNLIPVWNKQSSIILQVSFNYSKDNFLSTETV